MLIRAIADDLFDFHCTHVRDSVRGYECPRCVRTALEVAAKMGRDSQEPWRKAADKLANMLAEGLQNKKFTRSQLEEALKEYDVASGRVQG